MIEIKDKTFITFADTDSCDTISCKVKYKLQILQDHEDAKLEKQVEKTLMNYCGENGENEGLIECLNRKLEDAKKYRELLLEYRLRGTKIHELKEEKRGIVDWYTRRELQKMREGKE